MYDAWYETPFGRYADRLEKNLILNFLPEVNCRLILDVGCGTGNYSFMLARMGAFVVGVDTSLQMLAAAKERSKKLQAHLEFILADASMLPFRMGVFDLTLSILALCFIDTPINAAKEMKRVTKRNGMLILGTLNKWSSYGIGKKARALFIESSYQFAVFHTPIELKTLMGPAEWCSTIFALEWMPKWLLEIFYRIDIQLGRIFKPFGAFLATKSVTITPTVPVARHKV